MTDIELLDAIQRYKINISAYADGFSAWSHRDEWSPDFTTVRAAVEWVVERMKQKERKI
jgi:hypothetical protein